MSQSRVAQWLRDQNAPPLLRHAACVTGLAAWLFASFAFLSVVVQLLG